jgi:hypothetical protein
MKTFLALILLALACYAVAADAVVRKPAPTSRRGFVNDLSSPGKQICVVRDANLGAVSVSVF